MAMVWYFIGTYQYHTSSGYVRLHHMGRQLKLNEDEDTYHNHNTLKQITLRPLYKKENHNVFHSYHESPPKRSRRREPPR